MKDRIALITGGSRGIGQAIAKKMSENKIQVLTPTRKEMDLNSNQSIEDYMDSINEPIDIVVNNAGILKVGKFTSLTFQDFENTLQVNLIAPFTILNKVVNGMKERKFGRIVNLSSIRSTITKEGRSMYSASKSGLEGLTISLAVELAAYNILVNAVSPGYVKTDLTTKNASQQELNKKEQEIPLGRFSTPEEIAEVVFFLCSDKNTYLTGQTVVVDGGYMRH